MGSSNRQLGLSPDAAIVLGLADTAVPFAFSPEDEAERWVRVLRLHGWVGAALQSLGVGEAPLATAAQPASVRLLRSRPLGEDVVQIVTQRAHEFAIGRGAGAVCTVDVLVYVTVVVTVLSGADYFFGLTRGVPDGSATGVEPRPPARVNR